MVCYTPSCGPYPDRRSTVHPKLLVEFAIFVAIVLAIYYALRRKV